MNGTNYYYAKDHLGSIREVTNGSGVVQASYDYDVYGRQTQLVGTLQADFGYAGYYNYKTTCQYLTWFRVYDPDKGRWLSRDPLGEFTGSNLYDYVWNRPEMGVDPLGLWTISYGGNFSVSFPGFGGSISGGSNWGYGPNGWSSSGSLTFGWGASAGFGWAGGFQGSVTNAPDVCKLNGKSNEAGRAGLPGGSSINGIFGNGYSGFGGTWSPTFWSWGYTGAGFGQTYTISSGGFW